MPKNVLDHMYAHGLVKQGDVVVDTSTMLDVEPARLSVPNTTPSDHLPITAEFDL